MKSFPTLQTLRCRLERIGSTDISILQQIFNDGLTRVYLNELNDLVSSKDGIRIFIDSFDRYAGNGEGFLWGIFLNVKLVGFIALMDITYSPSLFYAMHPEHRSQGIMKECVTQVLNYISEINICSYVKSEVYKQNTVSIRLLESIGFEKTGFDEQKIFFSRSLYVQ